MGAGNSCSGNSYNSVLIAIKTHRCIVGPNVAIGMKHRTRPPVWLFGETHNPSRHIKKCGLLLNILRETLACSRACGSKKAHIFIEQLDLDKHVDLTPYTEEDLVNMTTPVQITDPPRWYIGEYPFQMDLARRVTDEMKQICDPGEIHYGDPLQVLRGAGGRDTMTITSTSINTYKVLCKFFKRENVEIEPEPDDSFTDTMMRIDRLLSEVIGPTVPEDIFWLYRSTIDSYLDAMYDFEQEPDEEFKMYVFSKVHDGILRISGDLMTVADMLKIQDANIFIGYWGSNHTRTQARFLQAFGYEVVHNWEGNRDEDGFEFATAAPGVIRIPRPFE